MTSKSEIKKVVKNITHLTYSKKIIELFKMMWSDGFKFAEWLQIGWVYTGTGWVKFYAYHDEKERSIEELYELFLKEENDYIFDNK